MEYMSKLQRYSDHKRWGFPKYTSTKDGPGRYKASVIVSGSSFDTPGFCKSSLDAQDKAAKLAFHHFTSSSDDPLHLPAKIIRTDSPSPMPSSPAVQNDQHAVNHKATSSSTYKWRIENVSKWEEKVHLSPIFSIDSQNWRLMAHRRGCDFNGYLSFYVTAVDCKNSRHAQFSLAVLDQANNQNTLRKDTGGPTYRFIEQERDWGFEDFIQYRELNDPRNGYTVNDACIIEVQLHINSAEESIEKLVPDELMDKERCPVTSSSLLANTSVVLGDSTSSVLCAFCQTSEVSEGLGSMLNFTNIGKRVEEDEASAPNVIHVHRRCIKWAPRVKYVDESVVNLELELAKCSKLICSGWALKGASLGCSVRSCRNIYHVPCAVGSSGCQWDDKGRKILCPRHSGMKLSHEKPRMGRTQGRTILLLLKVSRKRKPSPGDHTVEVKNNSPPPGLDDMETFVPEFDHVSSFTSIAKFVEYYPKLYQFYYTKSKDLATSLSGTQREKISLELEVSHLKTRMQELATRADEAEAALARKNEATIGDQEKLAIANARIKELESIVAARGLREAGRGIILYVSWIFWDEKLKRC